MGRRDGRPGRPALASLIDRGPWIEDASCQAFDPDLWFPSGSARDGNSPAYAKARAICEGCPVRIECADYAVRSRQPFGMWGGWTTEDRKLFARRDRPTCYACGRMPRHVSEMVEANVCRDCIGSISRSVLKKEEIR